MVSTKKKIPMLLKLNLHIIKKQFLYKKMNLSTLSCVRFYAIKILNSFAMSRVRVCHYITQVRLMTTVIVSIVTWYNFISAFIPGACITGDWYSSNYKNT